jgi:hypothetical protein
LEQTELRVIGEPISRFVQFFSMKRSHVSHLVPEPTPQDLERIGTLLRRIGGSDTVWGAGPKLDIWVIEQRSKLDQQMSERIRTTSVALVWATIGLVICTAALIWATLAA